MTTTSSLALADVAARYWDAALAYWPTSATYLGDRRFDDRMEDRSDEAIEAQRRLLHGFRGEIEAIDVASLVGEDRITRSALQATIKRDLASLDADLEAWTVDPLSGPQVAAMNLEAVQTISTPDQARAMVARWNALGPWFDGCAERLVRSVDEGKVGVRSAVEKAIDQLDTSLAHEDDDLPLLAPLRVDHPDWRGGRSGRVPTGICVPRSVTSSDRRWSASSGRPRAT